MDDREKIAKGIKFCKTSSTCVGCVYAEQMRPESHLNLECKLQDDVLEMLKEQEPVSVAGPDSYEEYWDREAICPDCGTHWMSYNENRERVTKYCPGCGRPVKLE